MCQIAHCKGAKVVVVIHDLGSFRRKKLTVAQEIHRLGHADYIIAHNSRMKQWLLDNGCKVPLGVLEIFDYLSETTASSHLVPSQPYGVVYAGALNPRKNTFCMKWVIMFILINLIYMVMDLIWKRHRKRAF